tara:strand:+ start:25591 stop:26568 length:978 start_codon:yes stop_codon:yes gene_type:complete
MVWSRAPLKLPETDCQMKHNNPQAPSAVIMIRPHSFWPNGETAGDNSFQRLPGSFSADQVARDAYKECTLAAEKLSDAGVEVHMFEDEGDSTPDSVFPNNWFSTHAGGYVAIYPMYAANRRAERRQDVIEMLKRVYRVQEVIDFSGLEQDDLFLEGTGAMVIDHLERVVYAVRSKRLSSLALERFCSHFGYEPVVFDAEDGHGAPVYHTNVLMCVATDFVMIGLDMIADPVRRDEIVKRFEQSGRTVIALSSDQISSFAGNALELTGTSGSILAISSTSAKCLTDTQYDLIKHSVNILELDIPTIECAGGSVRCMLAGIHLSKRS